MGKIKEYLKLARSFNSFLTALSPVMGAIAMGEVNLLRLTILFIIGFFGHTFGFVVNDIFDFQIDRHNPDLKDRPLISGTISMRNAKSFAVVSLVISIGLAVLLAWYQQWFLPLLFLGISALLVTVYNGVSKKLPLMDIFDTSAVFFLILYGAMTVARTLENVTTLAWIVCLLGAIQVFFMQIVPGGLKDIENDYEKGASTVAIKLGVRIEKEGTLKVPVSYRIVAYAIQLVDVGFVLLPFYLVFETIDMMAYAVLFGLAVVTLCMLLLTHKFLRDQQFDRDRIRKLLGSHFSVNFALVPVMLVMINPWALVLILFPPFGFVTSNLVLHGSLLQPKTM